ncbi:PIN domain-containing protein [Streptomyces sp. NBC_01262]|uniref:PIN domain-containing protein n=1 Tax=Streptomyces sp. NBC_01262 TaxID=2903803 RepID=UPI002E349D3F|nr:PIN domain-containing protein [Streptomyces sp. NBC_01262]
MSIGEASRRLADAIADLQGLGPSPPCVEYLAWADTCESRLRAVFAEPDITARLHTQRYWHLYRHHEVEADDVWVNTNLPVPDPAGQEVAAQLTYLASIARQTEQLGALAERPGRVLVYDTNSLMHYQPPDAIEWAKLVKASAVRLVVPLVVVDELDRKQHEGSEKMAQRARRALQELDKILDGTQPGEAAPLPERAGVSIEFLMDEPGHRREASADDEVIERSVLLAQIIGGSVAVVTADTGMRLRARAAGLETLRLPAASGKDQPTGN